MNFKLLNQRGVLHFHTVLIFAVVVGAGYFVFQRIKAADNSWTENTQAAITQSESSSEQADASLESALDELGEMPFSEETEE